MEERCLNIEKPTVNEIIEFLSIRGLSSYFIEDKSGVFFKVKSTEYSLSCECGGRLQSKCVHIQLLSNYFQSRFRKGSYFDFLSAFHKSIRRKDFRDAIFWSSALISLGTPLKMLYGYLRTINLEENTSFQLQKELEEGQETHFLGLLYKVCSAPKKQDFAEIIPIQELWPYSSLKVDALDGPMGSLGYLDKVIQSQDPLSLMTIFNYKNLRGVFFKKLLDNCSVIAKKLPKELSWVPSYKMSNDFYKAFHLQLALITEDYCYDKLNPKMKIPPVVSFKPGFIRLVPDEAYDIHTSVGMRRITRDFYAIRPNTRLPLGIDIRFSGSLLGVLWRQYCYLQFGEKMYTNTPNWEDVELPAHLWGLFVSMDALYYPSKAKRLMGSQFERSSFIKNLRL